MKESEFRTADEARTRLVADGWMLVDTIVVRDLGNVRGRRLLWKRDDEFGWLIDFPEKPVWFLYQKNSGWPMARLG